MTPTTALHLQREAELSLLATLAYRPTPADRPAWRRRVRAECRELRAARRRYHEAWTAFCAGRLMAVAAE